MPTLDTSHFPYLAATESDGPSLGLQMIYSYLLSGGSSHDKYDRFLRRMNMPPFSEPQFHKAMKDVMVAVLEQLEDEIEATKAWLKENDLWYNGLMGLDGSWCTPGWSTSTSRTFRSARVKSIRRASRLQILLKK